MWDRDRDRDRGLPGGYQPSELGEGAGNTALALDRDCRGSARRRRGDDEWSDVSAVNIYFQPIEVVRQRDAVASNMCAHVIRRSSKSRADAPSHFKFCTIDSRDDPYPGETGSIPATETDPGEGNSIPTNGAV